MTRTVPPQMPTVVPTRIAFVGEAPSEDDVAGKQPLVGPAGRVFNSMLRSANLEREEFLITNVFDQMPDDKDELALWLKDEGRLAESRARLNDELNAAQPTVIVPMGGTALWMFTGNRMVGNFRGAVTKATQLREGAKLVPTFDPEAVRKSWNMLPLVVTDFIKASSEADIGPQIVYPKVELLIEPTIEDIRRFAPMCMASRKLSVDIETGWGQITAIAFAPTPQLAMSIPFLDLRKPNRSYWKTAAEEFETWRLVETICKSDAPKLGQNFMYDIMWLYNRHGIPLMNYRYDTRIRHKAMYPELPADLANMSASYTRIGAYKGWGGRYQQEKKDG